MIVVLVIGLLAGLALPNIFRAIERSRIEQAKADLEMLSNAILQLAWDTGRWPGGLDRSVPGDPETWDLTTARAGLLECDPSLFPSELWRGPYINRVPVDPWGSPYFFDPDYRIKGSNRVVVGSFGPNRVGRNLYDDDDIYVILK